MTSHYEFYLPKENEPSVFTGQEGVIHPNWIEHSIKVFLGIAIDKGSKHFDAVKEFLETSIVYVNQEGFMRNMNPESYRDRIGVPTVKKIGVEIQKKILEDLKMGLPAELFGEPPNLLTPDGAISLRWVMFVANLDGMTPQEAYLYGVGLMR